MKVSTFLSLVFSVLLLPSLAFAAKPVTQSFPAEAVTYFPLKNGQAQLVANGIIFESSVPHVAMDWEQQETNAPRATFDSSVAQPYKQFDYVIATDTQNVGVSYDPVSSAIWRMKRSGDHALTKVLQIDSGSAGEYFTHLFVVDSSLFAITSEGKIWKTTDGTTWTNFAVTGLPDGALVQDITVNSSKVYVAVQDAVYYTRDGLTWKPVETNFGKSVNAVTQLVVHDGLLYTVTADNENNYTLWKRTAKKKWKTVLTDQNEVYELASHAGQLYVSQEKTATSFRVLKYTTNQEWNTVYSADGWANSAMRVGEKLLMIVHDNDESYLLRM